MLVQLPPSALGRLRPRFAGFPGLHGCLEAVLEGAMGTAHADDADSPSVALLHLDFYLLAGDSSAAAAEEVVRSLHPRASVVASGPEWGAVLSRVWGTALQARTRVAFRPGAWDRLRLRGFIEALPQGFVLRRI